MERPTVVDDVGLDEELSSALKGLSMKAIRAIMEELSVHMSWKALHWRSSFQRDVLRTYREVVPKIIDRAYEVKETIRMERSSRKKDDKGKRRSDYFEYLRRLRTAKLYGDTNSVPFPDIVPDKDQLERLKLYNQHTGDSYIQQAICCSCAGQFDNKDTVEISPGDVPNKSRLYPTEAHPGHMLYDDMLLHSESIVSLRDRGTGLRFCQECLSSLQDNVTPKFSLANNLWVGDIPIQLSILTIPERLLICLYYPSAYIVKLYPKAPNARHWHDLDVNLGLRGNVSTYKLDTSGIHDMIKGELMPRPPEILASLFSITLIGPQGKPDRAIKSLCQVRRSRVLDALLWLKNNNPLYSSITIDESILSRLPNGDVPDSIYHNVKHASSVSGTAEKGSNLRTMDITDADEDKNVDDDYPDKMEESIDEESHLMFEDPGVIALNESGVVDIDGFDIASSDLLVQALNNSTGDDDAREPPYAILRGNEFVNEYARRDEFGSLTTISDAGVNHLLGAFPYLFPYGTGGFETDRPSPISYTEHARSSLRYADGRFAKNITFLSLVFNVIQKRQVCLGAELQMKRKDYHKFERCINTITPSILRDAVKEERQGQLPSNPAVRTLKSFVKATRKHVSGTDENRISNRSKIYGMSLLKNPANIWMTITCDDVNDPVVQVYSGSHINLDSFNASLGPDAKERSRNSTQNPYAATKFFYRVTKLILEDLFGIKVTSNGRIFRERGILGRVSGYVGMVEAQGRGTLHLHLLLWLDGSPSSSDMIEKLKDESFRNKLEQFIRQNIKSHIDGLNDDYLSHETPMQKKSHKERASAYSRPIDPDDPDFQQIRGPLEFSLARCLQVHRCSLNACLLHDKFGRIRCKRRAPWTLSPNDTVYESGVWFSRRDYGFLNSWNPMLLFLTRSNNDMKLLTNGTDSRHVTYYITGYAAKAQSKDFQKTALLADSYSYIKRAAQDNTDIRQKNKKLLSQCAHTLTRGQELSNQQMVSYIMGFGDSLLSHRFVPIYLSGVLYSLEQSFPEFHVADPFHTSEHVAVDQDVVESIADNATSSYFLQMTINGFRVKNQLSDYMYRGQALHDYSFLNFLLETYEPKRFDYNEDNCRHERVPYLDVNDIYRDRLRILRHPDCEMMPDFLGSWVPRNDREDKYDFYCATILLLLKPWRNLQDLKLGFFSWSQAFDNFLLHATPRDKRIVDNFQFYYQSADAANKSAADEAKHNSMHNSISAETEGINIPSVRESYMNSFNHRGGNLDDIAEFCENSGEAYHGLEALDIAGDVGIFAGNDDNWTSHSDDISNASLELLTQNFSWQEVLKTYIKSEETLHPSVPNATSSVIHLDSLPSGSSSSVRPIMDTLPSDDPVHDNYLQINSVLAKLLSIISIKVYLA